MHKFNPENPNREKCQSCGHDKLTQDEKLLLAEDMKYPAGILIRDMLHNKISQEDAERLVPWFIGMGLAVMDEAMRYGPEIRDHVIASHLAQGFNKK